MAATRATQLIALRNLTRGVHQVRHLHMTGSKTSGPITLTNDHPVLELDQDLASKRRKIDLTTPADRRQFNTSRVLQRVHDQSTIDFAFIPALEPLPSDLTAAPIRVPIIPTNYNPQRTGAQALESDEQVTVMKPEISTMSADAVFLPMSEVHDGHAMDIDFHAMADTVAASVRRMKIPVEEQAGMMKQIWNGMVDDIFGATTGKKKATVA